MGKGLAPYRQWLSFGQFCSYKIFNHKSLPTFNDNKFLIIQRTGAYQYDMSDVVLLTSHTLLNRHWTITLIVGHLILHLVLPL